MLDPYDGEDLLELFTNVNVTNPRCEGHSHVSYEIVIETNNFSFSKRSSSVRRRFSDFVFLHKLLSKEFPAFKTPSLPPQPLFKKQFDPAFIERRRKGLEEFLTRVVSQKMYLSSKALHLFLQSDFTMNQIKDIIQGKVIESQYGSINNGYTEIQTFLDLSHDESHSSCAKLDVGEKSKNTPNHSNNDPSKSMGSKRVSFCEQVTVAQMH